MHVLIPCAGVGLRAGGSLPKQYQFLGNKRVVQYSIDAFLNLPEINSIWVAVSPELSADDLQALFQAHSRVHIVQTGGDTRANSVKNTLGAMIKDGIDPNDWVLVHDAARPGIHQESIMDLIHSVATDQEATGGILAMPVADTLKESHPDSPRISRTISREDLWHAQTPQMFRVKALHDALDKAIAQGDLITDEASAMELTGAKILLVPGTFDNFKMTFPNDIHMMNQIQNKPNSLRIGQGYDVHQLVEGRPLILGGVHIPHSKGLLGHSDADALLHAITDALLGSVSLGDIGRHFPDTDPEFAGIDSLILLKRAYQLVQKAGYQLVNLDATVICQQPKLAAFIPEMVRKISETLEVENTCINVKAKTNEKLGYLGNEEAIATQAIVLVSSF